MGETSAACAALCEAGRSSEINIQQLAEALQACHAGCGESNENNAIYIIALMYKTTQCIL